MLRATLTFLLLTVAATANSETLYAVHRGGPAPPGEVRKAIISRLHPEGDHWRAETLLSLPSAMILIGFVQANEIMLLHATEEPAKPLYFADLRAGTFRRTSLQGEEWSYAFDQVSNTLYGLGSTGLVTQVVIADPETGKRVPVATIGEPAQIAGLDPRRKRLYLRDHTSGLVYVDLRTGVVTPPLMQLQGLTSVLPDPDREIAFVFTSTPFTGTFTLVELDLTTRQTRDHGPTDIRATGAPLAVDAGRRIAYLHSWMDWGLSNLVRFDLGTRKFIQTGRVHGDLVDYAVVPASPRRRVTR